MCVFKYVSQDDELKKSWNNPQKNRHTLWLSIRGIQLSKICIQMNFIPSNYLDYPQLVTMTTLWRVFCRLASHVIKSVTHKNSALNDPDPDPLQNTQHNLCYKEPPIYVREFQRDVPSRMSLGTKQHRLRRCLALQLDSREPVSRQLETASIKT